MLQRINKSFTTLHFFLILFVCLIVLITRYYPPQAGLLRLVSAEGGLFEWGSFVISLTVSVFALLVYFRGSVTYNFGKGTRKFILLVAIGAFFIAMEEISWGQRVLGFESSDFFRTKNMQRETNLHNLISGEYLNLAIYSIIYIFFIYLPLAVYVYPDLVNKFPSLKSKISIYLPSLHNVLMFCFASSLQAYFLPRTIADTTFLWLAMLLVCVLLVNRKNHRNKFQVLHFLLVLLACIVFAICYQVFDYFNMQYEIREFVIGYAFLYWLFNWTVNVKNKIVPQPT